MKFKKFKLKLIFVLQGISQTWTRLTYIVNLLRSECLVFCVTTDVYFVFYLCQKILAWHCLCTATFEFPRPNKIDRFIHKNGDRKTELLSLSLCYLLKLCYGDKLAPAASKNYICYKSSQKHLKQSSHLLI